MHFPEKAIVFFTILPKDNLGRSDLLGWESFSNFPKVCPTLHFLSATFLPKNEDFSLENPPKKNRPLSFKFVTDIQNHGRIVRAESNN